MGLNANETQEAEWFGSDCSLRKLITICAASFNLYIHIISHLFVYVDYSCYPYPGHCPSADDPRTQINETDCSRRDTNSKIDVNTFGMNRTVGAPGNLCQVDCANQGICDYSTGTCSCFDGQYGTDCSMQVQLPAKYLSADGVYAPQPVQQGQSGGGSGDGGGSGAGQGSADFAAWAAADTNWGEGL